MITWIETYIKTHLFYIILIVMGVFAFRSWLSEHDARVQAENTVKQNAVIVASLQDGIKTRDAALAQKVQVITKIVHDVQTPAQAVAAVPQLVTPVQTEALQVKVAPDDPKAIEVQAVPFTELLGELKDTTEENNTCQADLVDQRKIVSTDEDTIKVLKKKPGFWKRVMGTGKAVGVGVGIGIVIAKRFL